MKSFHLLPLFYQCTVVLAKSQIQAVAIMLRVTQLSFGFRWQVVAGIARSWHYILLPSTVGH